MEVINVNISGKYHVIQCKNIFQLFTDYIGE